MSKNIYRRIENAPILDSFLEEFQLRGLFLINLEVNYIRITDRLNLFARCFSFSKTNEGRQFWETVSRLYDLAVIIHNNSSASTESTSAPTAIADGDPLRPQNYYRVGIDPITSEPTLEYGTSEPAPIRHFGETRATSSITQQLYDFIDETRR